MTKAQAERLAKFDHTYYARCIRGQWCVWCETSDHAVEFDADAIDLATEHADIARYGVARGRL